MKVKDGKSHLEAISGKREVILDGSVIQHVVDHPAFRNSCQTRPRCTIFRLVRKISS